MRPRTNLDTGTQRLTSVSSDRVVYCPRELLTAVLLPDDCTPILGGDD